MKDSAMDWSSIEAKLQKALTENRYRHTMGVTYTACALAMVHGADLNQARLAGLLHDCAKCISNKEKIEMCRKQKLDVTRFELDHPVLLHAKLGEYLAKKKYNVTDEAVLSAIRWHTTGKPAMTDLEKIIYIADFIEPNRDKAPNLTGLRKAAFEDLDNCMYLILRDSVEYLSSKPDAMDETTLKAYDYYRGLMEQRRSNEI